MGLAIAKELCEIFDGELSFDATEGSINIFWFTATFKLPVEIIENQDIIKATSKTENGLKILLVEDNILNQKFAKASLVRKQHTIEIAENGKIAIDKYNNDDYDLILMDIQLPIMDGIEATKQIRELESISGKHIIIIAVTAYALERDRKRCFEAGMDGFLSKPFRPDDLYKIIEKCYNEKKGF
jgi:CheY-like chemotaxis protein